MAIAYTLSEFKTKLRVTDTSEDTQITGYLDAAGNLIEAKMGITYGGAVTCPAMVSMCRDMLAFWLYENRDGVDFEKVNNVCDTILTTFGAYTYG